MKNTKQAERMMKQMGIKGEISGRANSTSWQVEFENELDMWNFRMKVMMIGGFKTGHGTWILATCCKPGDLRDLATHFQKDFVTSLPGGKL